MKQKKYIIKFLSVCLLASSLVLPAHAKSVKQKVSEDVPLIYPRSAWSTSKYDARAREVWPAEISAPKVIIVHHTATSYKNSTAKQIRKIAKYHSYTKKWGDIGYNYVIGTDGLIFEGRYGGNGVVGGHASGFNEGSIGIALLGDYQKKAPSAAALAALEKLSGWLAANNDINLTDSITFKGKKMSASMVGHRDVGSTACPGNKFYGELAGERSISATLMPSYASFSYSADEGSDNNAYQISGGTRSIDGRGAPTKVIFASQLSAYPVFGSVAAAEYTYPSGSLFRNEETGTIAMLEDGYLRYFPSPSVLRSNSSAKNLINLSAVEWSAYPIGSPMNFRSGSLVSSGVNYYFIEGGSKRQVVPGENALLVIDFSQAFIDESNQLAGLADGGRIASGADFPIGTILTTDYKNYHYVTASGKIAKIAGNVFKAAYHREMAVKISKKLFKTFKKGGRAVLLTGAAVKTKKTVYFVEKAAFRKFSSASLAKRMGFQDLTKIKSSDLKGLSKGAGI